MDTFFIMHLQHVASKLHSSSFKHTVCSTLRACTPNGSVQKLRAVRVVWVCTYVCAGLVSDASSCRAGCFLSFRTSCWAHCVCDGRSHRAKPQRHTPALTRRRSRKIRPTPFYCWNRYRVCTKKIKHLAHRSKSFEFLKNNQTLVGRLLQWPRFKVA